MLLLRHPPEAPPLELGVELDGAPGVFALGSGIGAVGLIQFRRLAFLALVHLAVGVDELSEPVVVPLVAVDGLLHDLGVPDLELGVVDLLRPLDDPGEDVFAALLVEDVAVVLDVVVVLDELVVEGDDDDPSPDAVVHPFDLGKVVGVEDEGMGRGKVEGRLVLLLAPDVVGGAEFLDLAVVQPCPFLRLAGDDEPLSPQLGQFRLDVPLAVGGQGVGAYLAIIGPQHPRDGVPESRLAVASVPIGDDDALDVDLADGADAANLLDVVDELQVVVEDVPKELQP